MKPAIRMREFAFPADYAAALKLWEGIERGVRIGRSDTPAEIERKLQRDADLFLVADVNGVIVGTIIGAYDGRRGMIYHLAVQKEFRNQGVASRLLDEVEQRLRARGCVKCFLFAAEDNDAAVEFYSHRGWTEVRTDRVMSKEFP